MAAHIESVAKSDIEQVSKGEFYNRILPGDLVFCSGRTSIDDIIEKETNSPFSHVFMLWTTGRWLGFWLTLEATFERGVCVGLMADYVDSYNGDLVLARRTNFGISDLFAAVSKGLSLLDDRYDWQQEVSIAARKLIKELPLLQPRKELYCSGLQYVMSEATGNPLQKPATSFPTPEDNWTDSSVHPVCALVR